MENDFWNRDIGKVVFISGNILIPLPIGLRDQRMRLLHMRSGGSTYR